MRHTAALGILGGISLMAGQAFGGTPMMVNPAVSSHPGAPNASTTSRTGTKDMTFRLVTSCYGTNLRSVANPLSPSSEVEARIVFKVVKKPGEAPQDVEVKFKFPGQLADNKGGLTGDATGGIHPSKITGAPGNGVTGRAYGNTVELKVPIPIEINIEADGDVVGEDVAAITVGSQEYVQTVNCGAPLDLSPWGYAGSTGAYGCGQYMARNGRVNIKRQNEATTSDNSNLELAVAFPGQNGFCGGFYSPLMLFFDDARPRFGGQSKFRLSAREDTNWVEANAPGHFLALDRNGNGRIDDKFELFGDQDSETNGFEALRELDSNKDGVIDAKDKKFKSLLLWNDKNGDGESQKGELQAASRKVKSISLSYERSKKSYGSAAEARQMGTFLIKDGRQGVVEDIWFAPIGR